MPREYQREVKDLPAIDIPDWQLIERLGELFAGYELEFVDREIGARDPRGNYNEETLEAFRQQVEAQDDPPASIWFRLMTSREEPDGKTNHWFQISMSPDHSFAFFQSTDEAVVIYLAERVRDLVDRAAERRRSRLEAGTGGAATPLPHQTQAPDETIPAAAAPPPAITPHATRSAATPTQTEGSTTTFWERHREIVNGLIITVFGGLILAGIIAFVVWVI